MKVFFVVLLACFLVTSFSMNGSFAQSPDTFEENDVTEPYTGKEQVLKNVGVELDESGDGFSVEYVLEGTLSEEVEINQDENSISFYYDPLESNEDVLIIMLPERLIENISFTIIDGEIEPDAIRENIGNMTTMYVPLFPDSNEITFVGSKVIPEFGSIAALILAISIISIVVLTSKKFPVIQFR